MAEAILTRSGGSSSALDNLALIAEPPKITEFSANGVDTGATGWTGTGLYSKSGTANATRISCGGYLSKIDNGYEIYLRPVNSNDPAIMFWTPIISLYNSTTNEMEDVEYVWNPDRYTYIAISSENQGISLSTNASYKNECNAGNLRWEFRPPAIVQYGVCNGLSIYYTEVDSEETFAFSVLSTASFRNSTGSLSENLLFFVNAICTGVLTSEQSTLLESLTQLEQSIIAISCGIYDLQDKFGLLNVAALRNSIGGIGGARLFSSVINIDNIN